MISAKDLVAAAVSVKDLLIAVVSVKKNPNDAWTGQRRQTPDHQPQAQTLGSVLPIQLPVANIVGVLREDPGADLENIYNLPLPSLPSPLAYTLGPIPALPVIFS